ncbi:MAG: tRNA 2-thiouridine(34) synthase MnmA [Minisyncoccia bacterium]
MRASPGKTNKNVFVGMSGGVDSSVSAALLKKAGNDVTGVFMKVWQPDWLECDWKEERLDAMRAAAHIGIPFVTLDLQKEYKEGVIDYMISEYKAGRTPNPDVACNREVKFGAFWKWAKGQGADLIATGHYARNKDDRLFVSKDTNKDQTYFLWTLTKDDLKHILFPIGGMTKPEVRKLAKDLKLPNADKKDSQGLCFIGKVDLKGFLRHYIRAEPGEVLSENGEVIGKHPGALLFTIGERRGFTITKKTPADAPYFVIGKDVEHNIITVSNKSADNSLSGAKKVVEISRINWISGAPEPGRPLKARSRYRETLQGAKASSTSGDKATIEFDEPQSTLTPGQSLVIYDGGECLGGGIIV